MAADFITVGLIAGAGLFQGDHRLRETLLQRRLPEAGPGQAGPHIRVGHEKPPQQAGAVIFGHQGHGQLVDGQVVRADPVVLEADGVPGAVRAPDPVFQPAAEIVQHFQGIVGGVGQGGQSRRGGHHAQVVDRGGNGVAAVPDLAGRQPPKALVVAPVGRGALQAIGPVGQGLGQAPHEIAPGHPIVGQTAGIQPDEGIVGQKQGAAAGGGGLQAVAGDGAGPVVGPGSPVVVGPAADGPGGRGQGQDIGDQGLVVALDFEPQMPPLGRPVPEKAALLAGGEPVPVHGLPQFGNQPPEFRLRPGPVEIGPGDQKALHQQGGLHQIDGVIAVAEVENSPGLAVQPMGEGAAPLRPGILAEKAGDL